MNTLSFRLITTGLNDVHSVIGFKIDKEDAVLIQPRGDEKFSYDAMHDINGISIPQLKQWGSDREETLTRFIARVHDADIVFVYYLPFIKQFLGSIYKELDVSPEPINMIDVHSIAKDKKVLANNLKLGSMYDYYNVDTIADLYYRLETIDNIKKVRRV